MKRIVSLSLVLLFLFSCCSTALCESDDSVTFTPTLTSVIDKQAKEWFSTSYSRATLTVLLALDFSLALEDDPSFDMTVAFSELTYVGKNGFDLVVYLHGGEKDVLIVYRPITGEASYVFTDERFMDILVDYMMESVCSDGYYENDIEDLFEVVSELKGIF